MENPNEGGKRINGFQVKRTKKILKELSRGLKAINVIKNRVDILNGFRCLW
jgi:hypothetical protein